MIIGRERIENALPGYTVGDRLGSGRFGLVLAAEHRQMRRPVAIKVMEADGAEGVTLDFSTEARVLGNLDHPHVVRAFEYIEVDGLCLVVMELLAGGTLTRRRREMAPAQACGVGLAVAAALEHAHGRGVLHRDIKTDNILFTAEGTPKVTDFGIAKLFDGYAATASGMAGTPMYMAPEQIEGGRLGPPTDLYALGVVLYHLLTGRAPFKQNQPVQALWRQHLTDPPPPMTGVPDSISAVVQRTLAKAPSDRYPDAAAFALDLAHAATDAYGPGWTDQTGLQLYLDRALRHTIDPAPPPPVPSTSSEDSETAPAGIDAATAQPNAGADQARTPLMSESEAALEGRAKSTTAPSFPATTRIAHPSPAPVRQPLIPRPSGRLRHRPRGGRAGGIPRHRVLLWTSVGAGFMTVAIITVLLISGLERPGPAAPSTTSPTTDTTSRAPATERSPEQVWRAVLTELNTARSAAFEQADKAALDLADAPGSPALQSDQEAIRTMVERGAHSTPVRIEILDLTVLMEKENEVVLRITESVAPYEFVDDSGIVLATEPGDPAETIEITLRRTAAGWRKVSSTPVP